LYVILIKCLGAFIGGALGGFGQAARRSRRSILVKAGIPPARQDVRGLKIGAFVAMTDGILQYLLPYSTQRDGGGSEIAARLERDQPPGNS